MPTLKVPLNNFQFGEVSPSLTSRTDTKYIIMQQNKLETFG